MSQIELMMERSKMILEEANYEIFNYALPNIDLSFELLARHRSHSYPALVIKFVLNIDSIKPHYIHEIKLISQLISAIPVLIGVSNRREDLVDNSIYIRKNLIAINLSTFTNIIQTPQLPLAIAKKGGYFLDLDGEKLGRLRQDRHMSRKDLAEKLDVSTKAIMHYETHNMRASREHAEKIENILGESVISSVDFYDFMKYSIKEALKAFHIEQVPGRKISTKTPELIKMVNEIVEETGFKIFWTKASPYDIVIYSQDEDKEQEVEYTFMGGTHCVEDPDSCIQDAQKQFLSSSAIDQRGIIYDDESYKPKQLKKDPVPYLKADDLKLLEHPDDFKKLIKKQTERLL